MSRRVVLAFLSLLLIAVLSGCSAKNATEDAATDTTVGSSTAATQPSTNDTTNTDTAPTDTGTTDGADLAAVAGPAASQAGSCPTQDEIDSMQSRMDEASSSATSSDELASQYEATFTFFGAYLPEERQGDLDIVRNGFSTYMQALSGMDLSNPDALSQDQYGVLNAAGEAMDTPDFEAAQSRITDYFTQTCPGVNFGDTGAGTSDTTPN